MKRALALAAAMFAAGLLAPIEILPTASANDSQAVVTESGRVRCYVNTDDVSHGGGPLVVCQTRDGGYAHSPMGQFGQSKNLAVVRDDGEFWWDEGNIPWSQEATANDIVLSYGQTFYVNGWTIEPSFDGTSFTHSVTGRGMFVSVENVYSF